MAFNECWDRGSPEPEKSEELLVFGYSCKFFRDDEKALHIDKGKHLIPWMNDDNLMIDRYDGRLHLYNVADLETQGEAFTLSKSEQEEEEALDKERYYDLNKDLEAETYQEEELKRLRAAVALDGAYHETPFNYDQENGDSGKVPSQNLELPKGLGVAVVEEEEDLVFTPPEGLVCQPNMVLALPGNQPSTTACPSNQSVLQPSTMREFAIIEKTAQFVSQQGGQMEIFIKMKQGNNPQFCFLSFEDPLNPFYKWLVAELKSGRYKPKPPLTWEDAYSLLVKNLQNLVSSESRGSSPHQPAAGTYVVFFFLLIPSTRGTGHDNHEDGSPADTTAPPPPPGLEPVQLPVATTVTPPPNIQAIIDKMAVYASKNGDDFETIVKSKEDKRFDFLYPWNQYHHYYLARKKHYCGENKPAPSPTSPAKPQPAKGPPAPVSFSLKSKEDSSEKPKTALLLEPDSETETSQVTDGSQSPKDPDASRKQEARIIADKLKDKLAAAARDRLQARKVQLERKRKAALFLDQLNKLNNGSTGSASPATAPLATEDPPPSREASPRCNSGLVCRKKSATPQKRSRSHSKTASPAKRRRRSPSSSSSSSNSESRHKKRSKKHSKKKKKKKHHHHHKSRHHSPSNHRAKTPPAAYLLVRRWYCINGGKAPHSWEVSYTCIGQRLRSPQMLCVPHKAGSPGPF
ncbi:SFSWAP [Cordylochernes scorpioides]|uniref:SFSWAP n=1 Tax=Cordylochernes scorpioides TaxID=51811 RepID=A0ABY6KKC1_9ARAC|nr:SFSWAP [Cordylochernes scorpioides]